MILTFRSHLVFSLALVFTFWSSDYHVVAEHPREKMEETFDKTDTRNLGDNNILDQTEENFNESDVNPKRERLHAQGRKEQNGVVVINSSIIDAAKNCSNYFSFPCTTCSKLPPCKANFADLCKEEEATTCEPTGVSDDGHGQKTAGGFPDHSNDTTSTKDKQRKETQNMESLDCYMGTCCSNEPEHNQLSSGSIGCLSQRQNRTYAVIRCPLSFPDSALRKDCEEGRGTHTRDDPVTEVSTGVVYRNRHCARCHGAQHLLLPWTLHIFCEHFQDLYQKTSEEDILSSLKDADMGGDDVCDLAYLPPPGTFPPSCPSFFPYSTPHNPDPLIRTCNVTGLWKMYDALTEQRCEETSPLLVYLVREGKDPYRFYKNRHCAICNGFKPVTKNCHSGQITQLPTIKQVPLTFLLGLHEREEQRVEKEAQCSADQWWSFDGVCRNISCPAGKLWSVENKTCTTAAPMSRGLVYHVDFLLVPASNSTIQFIDSWDEMVAQVRHVVLETFTKKTKNLVTQFFITYEYHCSDDSYETVWQKITHIHVCGNIKASNLHERDKAEENLVKNLFEKNWIVLYHGQIIELAPVVTGVDSGSLIQWICYTETHNGGLGKRELSKMKHFHKQASRRIVLNNLLNCALVKFDSSEYSTKYRFINHSITPFYDVTTETTEYIGPKKRDTDNLGMSSDSHTSERSLKKEVTHLILMEKELSFRDLHFSWQIDTSNNLHVCVDKLEELYVRPRSSSSPWQYLLSMTAIPLSILCLCLVLLVYTLLPALRTQPGLNTMGTCFTLLLAQLLLLLSSHRLLPGTWCIALGILVHMFWLSTFCWTSVCSVHMFRAFSFKNEFHSGPGSYKSLIANTAVTLLIPGVIVAVVVVVSWHRSGGESLGYSSSSCYLQSPMLVGLALILPLSIIVTFNTVLYSVTVYRIYKICQLQECVGNETEKGHQHLTACLRLSLLTGSCWFLSILAEGMDVDWLRGLSIVANGGQGMLLLLSYVTTRGVAAMLAVRFGLKRDVTSRSNGRFP